MMCICIKRGISLVECFINKMKRIAVSPSRFDKHSGSVYGVSEFSLPRLSGYDEMSTEPSQ